MSFARAMRRGEALNARFGVNGSQYDWRSFGITVRCATDIGPLPCRSATRLLPTARFRIARKMAEKTNKLTARLPRGFADRGAVELAAARAMLERIRVVYERYGFE